MELSPEEAIDRLYQNGITCSELSDEHGLQLLTRNEDIFKTAKEFKAFLAERNFEVSQGHLWLKVKICEDDVETLFRWIDLYEAIGIRNMVLHCDNLVETNLSVAEKTEKNVEKLSLLARYVKGRALTICLENLRPHGREDLVLIDSSIEQLLSIIERVDSPNFGVCLDTGHLNLTHKNQREFILTAGEKLKALHIADNQGVIDQHLMPFNKGNVNFVEVVQALREVNYQGLFNLEIPGERGVPIVLRDAKIPYIKACYEYLMNV